ncbi:MAG: 2'-5' RNA ligase family protein [Flavobacteriales bacterium]|nr:2'-5' RNA ligase family protein [Flavobacteriales bacterium]
MLHRFLLTILPAPALAAQVERLRSALHARIGSFSGRHNPPHITLCFLDLPAAHEPAIMDAIARGVTGQPGFTLHYHVITHFPDKRTIYIDPVEKEGIATVRTAILEALKSDPRLHTAVRETDHPHLTLAAGLKPHQFDAAWDLLAPHTHTSTERVTEVVLLKRVLLPGERYIQVRSFLLAPS